MVEGPEQESNGPTAQGLLCAVIAERQRCLVIVLAPPSNGKAFAVSWEVGKLGKEAMQILKQQSS